MNGYFSPFGGGRGEDVFVILKSIFPLEIYQTKFFFIKFLIHTINKKQDPDHNKNRNPVNTISKVDGSYPGFIVKRNIKLKFIMDKGLKYYRLHFI